MQIPPIYKYTTLSSENQQHDKNRGKKDQLKVSSPKLILSYTFAVLLALYLQTLRIFKLDYISWCSFHIRLFLMHIRNKFVLCHLSKLFKQYQEYPYLHPKEPEMMLLLLEKNDMHSFLPGLLPHKEHP